MPVKPLAFKGDKKTKKRKHHELAADVPRDSSSKATEPHEDDSWLSPENATELAGPTVIVLPTVPPTCIAADPDGNVFASPLENIIEDNPQTAEPHTVQQVWVASRVAGMKENEVNFKGSHGGYLSCDQYGILGARREARGVEENFTVDTTVDEASGRISYLLRTAASKSANKPEDKRYISATSDATLKKVSVAIRGDAEAGSDEARLVLRMQARFRPQTAEAKEAVRSREKVSRSELERAAGRSLTDEEAKRLKRAKRDGTYHEEILDLRAKGKHDKYA